MNEERRATPKEKQELADDYRLTHSRDGYPLGSPEYPDNRSGRRALARSWKGHR